MILEGYPIIFGGMAKIKEHYEVITKEALEQADLSDVTLTLNHNARQTFARTKTGSLILTIDDRGLKMKAKLNSNLAGKQLYESVSSGKHSKMSFTGEFLEDNTILEDGVPTVYITKIGRIFDVSVVDKPAYTGTSVRIGSDFNG